MADPTLTGERAPAYIVPSNWTIKGFGEEGPTTFADQNGTPIEAFRIPAHVATLTPGRNLYSDKTIRDQRGRVLEDNGAGNRDFLLPPGARWVPVPGTDKNRLKKHGEEPSGGEFTAADIERLTPLALGGLPNGSLLTSLDVMRMGGPGIGAPLLLNGALEYTLSGLPADFVAAAKEFGIDPYSPTAADDLQAARRAKWEAESQGAIFHPDATGGWYSRPEDTVAQAPAIALHQPEALTDTGLKLWDDGTIRFNDGQIANVGNVTPQPVEADALPWRSPETVAASGDAMPKQVQVPSGSAPTLSQSSAPGGSYQTASDPNFLTQAVPGVATGGVAAVAAQFQTSYLGVPVWGWLLGAGAAAFILAKRGR